MAAEPANLVADLRRLGAHLPTDRLDDGALATAVLSRLTGEPVPRRGWWHRRQGWWRDGLGLVARRRRRVLIAVAVVLLSLLGVPAVRAAVAEWFSFGGVQVEIRPTPGAHSTPAPPPTAAGTDLQRARDAVAFRPFLPAALGPPDRVEVSGDRRVLSLTWNDPSGTIRLDEFDGRLDYTFAKRAPGAEWVILASGSGLWFDQPHEVVVLDAAGNPRTETARLAGHTLIWEAGATTLRLEGEISKERAIEIAGSVRPMP
jgi:hypothetical protein